MEDVRLSMTLLKSLIRRLLTRENLYALLLCLILIGMLIMTAATSPQWIYQGF
jgi:cytochrome b561